ncbi:ammonium transporter [Desulfosporosinus fructosivorans]|uniref:Ammonium transporter n=1 Tax=Desulfosporosinus fructosivorans TaxID=2018669 RepID=A0A4Z0R039_9FIRM|nr:ammonium transporter [Desulfosporosinus fructosivorans]TGE35685.1 ammonium transporter [Desulfosporosinus fructosivorans]
MAIPAVALADGPTVESNAVAIDTIWVLITGFLVFFMQAGFAMVETGFTRAKNAGNIIMKNLMDFAVGSLIYWVLGFAIMFGVDYAGLFGTTGFGTSGNFDHLGLSIPIWAFLLFQTVFAATAATIVSGAMAERTKFISYIIYSIVISALIYPVVGHWIWGGGWLQQRGMIDFAGSTVVHSVGGWAALIGALLIGPRLGKYSKDGKASAIPGHNITLGALGVFILWFGWFGFNPGSTLSGTSPDIAKIAVNTNLAAAAGATMTMFFTWMKYKKPDVSLTLNGALAGLVAITAGCNAVSAAGSAAIGALAGILVVLSVSFIDNVLRIDDPVGAISVHGVCGAFGTAMVGFFAVDGGVLYGGGISLLITQLIGIAAVFVWTAGTALILFGIIKATIGLRVSAEEEIIGLDIGEHGMEAYAGFEMKAPSGVEL